MVENSHQHFFRTTKLLAYLSYLLAGGSIAQILGGLAAYFSMEDSQAAGMIANLLSQHLSYYFLGCTFVILSLSNILIRHGMLQLKTVRFSLLILIVTNGVSSYLIIPRMDYLRESALQDGLPVIFSPFATYFSLLNGINILLLCTQIFASVIIAWRLGVLAIIPRKPVADG